MSLGVGQRERTAPGPAEDEPALDPEMPAQPFDIGDQIPGGIVGKRCEWAAAPRASLVEQYGPANVGIEKTPGADIAATARAAMQKYRGSAIGLADLFVIDSMVGAYVQKAAVERLGSPIENLFSSGIHRNKPHNGDYLSIPYIELILEA